MKDRVPEIINIMKLMNYKMENTRLYDKLFALVRWNDKNFYSTMNSDFFKEKLLEELEEFKEASLEYRANSKDRFTKRHMIDEMSDAILSSTSALQNGVDSKLVYKVYNSIKECKENVELDMNMKIEEDDLVNLMIFKMSEIKFGVSSYEKILAGDKTSTIGSIQHKIRTRKELEDPKNKMKIIKEIRRQFLVLYELGKVSI